MNKEILSKAVQMYIQNHRTDAPVTIALKKSPFESVSSSELANQVDGWQRCKKKLPDWIAKNISLYYPTKLNLEQCSSSETGRFKSSLIIAGSTLVDLTGGFGVDSYYFAQRAKKIVHCELEPKLSEIVAHNMHALKVENIQFHQGDGIGYLQSCHTPFDYLYSDPSRRVKHQKVFRLEDCEPNILENQDLFFAKARTLITKTAPLLDISLALQSLPHVKDVYVLSIDNDCKELIFVQEKGYTGDTKIHAIRIYQGVTQGFTFDDAQERNALPSYSDPLTYLYEPDVALTKAGAFKSLAVTYALNKLHPHSHLYTSESLVVDFPGRIHQIDAAIPLSVFKRQNNLGKANVIAKNFPLKVDEIRKKFKIKEGGDKYIYFTTQSDDKPVVIIANRIV